MKDVFVKEKNKLAKAVDFASGPNIVLMHSRIVISFMGIGMAAGSVEEAIKYAQSREAFKKKIGQFQMMQQLIVESLAKTQAMIMLLKQTCDLNDKGECSYGQRAMAKAYCSKEGREVTRMCREVLGGVGILSENRIQKHMMDMEVVHTGEGTYQVNTLVAGREFLGLKAFK